MALNVPKLVSMALIDIEWVKGQRERERDMALNVPELHFIALISPVPIIHAAMPGSEIIIKEMALCVLKLEIIAINVLQPVALLIFKIFKDFQDF